MVLPSVRTMWKAGLKERSVNPSKSRLDSLPSTEIWDSTCPQSTANYYHSHVIARPAIPHACHRAVTNARVSLTKWTWSPRKLADQAHDRLRKVSYSSNLFCILRENIERVLNRLKERRMCASMKSCRRYMRTELGLDKSLTGQTTGSNVTILQ